MGVNNLPKVVTRQSGGCKGREKGTGHTPSARGLPPKEIFGECKMDIWDKYLVIRPICCLLSKTL